MNENISLEEKLNILRDIVLTKNILPYVEENLKNPKGEYPYNEGYFQGIVDTYFFLKNNDYRSSFPWDYKNENSNQFDLIENLK